MGSWQGLFVKFALEKCAKCCKRSQVEVKGCLETLSDAAPNFAKLCYLKLFPDGNVKQSRNPTYELLRPMKQVSKKITSESYCIQFLDIVDSND